MKILLFVAAGVLAAQPSIRLEPAVIPACQNGRGAVIVFWASGNTRHLTILIAAQISMSGERL